MFLCSFFFSLLCAVFSCFHTTGCEAYSFTTDGYRIFNTRTNVGACHTHEGGSGTNRGSNTLHGSSDLNSDALTTELVCPPPPVETLPPTLSEASAEHVDLVNLFAC